MNTSSYSPIASGTYNRWKVEFVVKTKMTKKKKKKKKKKKNQYNTGYGGTLYNAAWWFPFFYILDHCCLKEMRR